MKKIVTTLPVEIALRNLDAENVRRIEAWFDHLKKWDSDQFVRSHSYLLDSVPGVYVFHTSTEIRIFFRIDGDTITILDLGTKSGIMASARVPEAG